MQIFFDRVQFLAVFQLWFVFGIKSDLRQCADFDKNFDVSVFPHQNELHEIFDAFDRNDTHQMERLLKIFESFRTEELDESQSTEYKNDPIKYVVRLQIHNELNYYFEVTLGNKMLAISHKV